MAKLRRARTARIRRRGPGRGIAQRCYWRGIVEGVEGQATRDLRPELSADYAQRFHVGRRWLRMTGMPNLQKLCSRTLKDRLPRPDNE